MFNKQVTLCKKGRIHLEIILILVAGIIVFIIAIISIIRGVTYRVQAPTKNLKDEVSKLQKRVNELENEKKNRSEEHTPELQSRFDLVCRLLLEKKKKQQIQMPQPHTAK